MSKLNIRISYKDACILKHALRDKIDIKEGMKDDELSIVLNTSQTPEKFRKELSEEKRALERFTDQIDARRKCFKAAQEVKENENENRG